MIHHNCPDPGRPGKGNPHKAARLHKHRGIRVRIINSSAVCQFIVHRLDQARRRLIIMLLCSCQLQIYIFFNLFFGLLFCFYSFQIIIYSLFLLFFSMGFILALKGFYCFNVYYIGLWGCIDCIGL